MIWRLQRQRAPTFSAEILSAAMLTPTRVAQTLAQSNTLN